MDVRNAIENRLNGSAADGAAARLPERLELDRADRSVHVSMLRRLSAHRLFSHGSRSGLLRRANAARPFRLDVRQRVIVKALVSRHLGAVRGAGLAKHVAYLWRAGTSREGERGEFYDVEAEDLNPQSRTRGWHDDRHHFRFIISPEHGDRIEDLTAYVRDVMGRVAADLDESRLDWLAINHFDTDQPHAHVLVRGKREDGRDLVIPREYIGYGFRLRAQEAAQELLGELSRHDAEARLWREVEADRFTRFDREIVAQAEADGIVADGAGKTGSYAALMRGRLAHLERLGLAQRTRGGFAIAPDAADRLRRLQIEKDVIRTLQQRRLEGARDVRLAEGRSVSGTVVRSGCHDEIGTRPYVVVRDPAGVEHYAPVRLAQGLANMGTQVELTMEGMIGQVRAQSADRGL